jgi:hypothetical protein
MFFKAFLVLAVIAAASAVRVNIRACPGGVPMPLWFESNDCTATRCSLRRGQVFTGRAAVVPARAFSTLLVELRATLFGIPFPLSIPAGYENACNFLEAGATCPVSQGTEYVSRRESFVELLNNFAVLRSGLSNSPLMDPTQQPLESLSQVSLNRRSICGLIN